MPWKIVWLILTKISKRRINLVGDLLQNKRDVQMKSNLDKAFEILMRASESAQREENECQIFLNLVSKKLAKCSSELQSIVRVQ